MVYDNIIHKCLFRNCGKKYYYESIGKNGEKDTSLEAKIKRVHLYTNYYKNEIKLNYKKL